MLTEEQDLDAGDFSAWLELMRNNQVASKGSDVPCGDCNACCRSSYFIHIKPEETESLACIPKSLLFPAPGLPKGNMVLGFNEKGSCPMLVKDQCSIYAHRPQTCRDYDCRVFAACGIQAGGGEKALIIQQTARWKFSYPSKQARYEHSALQATARFLKERGDCFPGGVPTNPSQIALVAVKVYGVLIKFFEEFTKTGQLPTDHQIAEAIMVANTEANKRFENKCGR